MNINNLFTNPKEIKYSINNVDAGYFFTSQISNNGKFLVYGGLAEVLKIYEIKLDKIIKTISFRHKILVC